MASAYAALGKARRKQAKIARNTAIGMEVISSVGEVAAFGAGQKKKADTAWEEYEAGYKELGGDAAKIPERPKFGQKGYFKGPEGEVQIGGSMYDRSKIQKAGSFLSSDASAILDEETRTKYLERTAPGRDISSITLQQPSKPTATSSVSGAVPSTPQFPTQKLQSGGYDQPPKKPIIAADEYDVDEEFGNDAWTAESPVYQQGEEPGLSDVSRSPVYKQYTPSRQHAMPGPNVNIDFKSKIKQGFKNVFSSEGFTGEGGGTGVKTGESQIPDMLNTGTAQDPYTDKQRQPYMDNPENSWFDSWKKNLSKQVKEGTDSTTWYN